MEIASLEKELSAAQHELEVARVEYEKRFVNPPNHENDFYYHWLNEMQNRFIVVKKELKTGKDVH